MTFNDLERRNGVILRCFSEFGYLPGALRKSSRSLSHLLMSSCRCCIHVFCMFVGLCVLHIRFHSNLIITSGQSNFTTGRIAAPINGSVVFVRWHLCELHLIHASLGPPEFKSQTASRPVQPFLHLSPQSIPIGPSVLP